MLSCRFVMTSRNDLVSTDASGRVAKQLLRLAQRFSVQRDGSVQVDHDLTQDEIAQLVGSSRETVNKVLSDFANQGWIKLSGKGLLIADTERVLRRAQVQADGRRSERSGRGMFHRWLPAIMATPAMRPRFRRR
ncbi:hypothetical protein CG716_14160 [Mycolicibacterium sphagni]|uniref:HTH crp-type domain-containing protein n=1 Tax=Mycolicibacterium sphagni TaxID=1786 RepID=A0A255DP40_9MYCO|nr:hypothetical protein CG716_14160 [Mycolicibacterium sphagni]